MSKSIKPVTVKTLTAALSPVTTVASVEAYDKAIAKAIRAGGKADVKAAKAKDAVTKAKAAIFAPDGKTRVSVSFNNAALAISSDATKQGEAQLALASVNQSMSERMRVVWSFGGFTTETTPSQAFKALIEMGYLPAGTVAGLSEAERAANMVTYGKPRHPVYSGLSNTHWKQLEAVKNSKARAATAKIVKSTDAKGLTDVVLESMPLATDVHVKATCKKFMELQPALTQRSALLKEIAALLGFSVEGIKSL